jgi:hypothetical protein
MDPFHSWLGSIDTFHLKISPLGVCIKVKSKIKLSLEYLQARLSQKSEKRLFHLKLHQLAASHSKLHLRTLYYQSAMYKYIVALWLT